MERKEILDEAARIVTGERQNQYGSAEDSFALIGGLWSDYLGVYISPRDVALMMILLKVARERGGKGKTDNWIDIAGYAACGGEVATVDTVEEKPTDYLRKATAGMRPKYIKFLKAQIEKQTDDKHKPPTCCCDDIAKIAKDNEYKRELLNAIFRDDPEEADEDDSEGESEWPDEDPTDWWTDGLTGCQVGTSGDGWVHVSLNRHTLPFGTAGFSDKTVDALIKSIGKSINEEVVDENKRNMMAMLWAVKRYKEMKEDEDDED